MRNANPDNETMSFHSTKQKKNYFLSPGLISDICLLVIESCSRHMSCSLCQEFWFPVGQHLIVITHLHRLSRKTLQGKGGRENYCNQGQEPFFILKTTAVAANAVMMHAKDTVLINCDDRSTLIFPNYHIWSLTIYFIIGKDKMVRN